MALNEPIKNIPQTKIKIISLNTNSLISNFKRVALTKLIEDHNPDILLLNETHLNPNHTFYLKNYEIVRNDRHTTKGGGTAIIYKNNIKAESVHTGRNCPYSQLENTAIKIHLQNNKFFS